MRRSVSAPSRRESMVRTSYTGTAGSISRTAARIGRGERLGRLRRAQHDRDAAIGDLRDREVVGAEQPGVAAASASARSRTLPTTPTTVSQLVVGRRLQEIVGIARQVHPPADRILAGPEALRQPLVDDDGPRRALAVGGGERPAAHDRHAQGIDQALGDVDLRRRDHRLARRHLVALGEDDAVAVVAAERQRAGQAGRAHPGHGAQGRQQPVVGRRARASSSA